MKRYTIVEHPKWDYVYLVHPDRYAETYSTREAAIAAIRKLHQDEPEENIHVCSSIPTRDFIDGEWVDVGTETAVEVYKPRPVRQHLETRYSSWNDPLLSHTFSRSGYTVCNY